jgi:hypothetical protein
MGAWVPESDREDSPSHVRRPQKGAYVRKILLVTGAASIFLSLTTYCLLSLNLRQPSISNCGHSAAEARANGCHYEPMLASWIPTECYEPEPRDEYAPYDDRAWFWDYNMTIPMVGEDLERKRRGDDITGYTKFFHDEHCLYAWRKLHLAVEKRRKLVDSKTMDLHHSTHCSKRIAKLIYNVGMWGYNETLDHTSRSPVMYQTCVPLPWKTRWDWIL